VAVNGPEPTFLTDAVLVTVFFPLVLTVMGPDGGTGALGSDGGRPPRITAGPYWARAPSLSAEVIAVLEPPPGSVTDGLALATSPGGAVCPHPRTVAGPPNRLTFV
jgi:hypothetical protein